MDISGSIGIIMWIVAIGTLVFDIVLGAVLFYHWTRFSMNKVVDVIAIIAYACVSGMLFISMFGAAVSYSL